jgi:hypothetical protein
MRIKQLLLSLITLLVFLTSCSKENILGSEINPVVNMEHATMSTSSDGGTQTPLRAYIFVEPNSKGLLIRSYLRTLPFTGRVPFLGFHGVGLGENLNLNSNFPSFPNFTNYIDMPHWIDGRLPRIMQVDIPQTSGGIDTFGNPIQAFNFKTVKITKNTVNDQFSYIIVLIPINAMNNDTKGQRQIHIVEKAGNRTISSIVSITDNVLSTKVIINYTGNRIPSGQYRIYTTRDRGMVLNLNSKNDVYLRGFSN